jgi:hypothetical protein
VTAVHGAFSGTVEVDGNDLIINGKRIHVTAERDPANLPHAAKAWTSRWNAPASSPTVRREKHLAPAPSAS